MKFKVNIEDFKQGLNEIKDTIGSEKMLKEGLRLFADDAKGRVRLTTNDGSYATDTWVNADVQQSGEIILVAKIFYQYFSKIEDATANMSSPDGKRLVVRTKRGQQTFMALADERFEPICEIEPTHDVDISGRIFKQMVNGVSFATDLKGSRGETVLEGIHIISNNGKVTQFVSTDRSTVASIKKKLSLPKKTSMIVGAKAFTRIARAVRDDEKISMLLYPKGVVGIKHKETTHFSPLYEGVFPDVDRVLKNAEQDDSSRSYATVDKHDLLSVLERASLLCDTTAFIKLDTDRLTIKGSSSHAEFNEFIKTNVENDPVEVRFSVRGLINIVKNIQNDRVTIGVEKGKSILCIPDSTVHQVCILPAMREV